MTTSTSVFRVPKTPAYRGPFDTDLTGNDITLALGAFPPGEALEGKTRALINEVLLGQERMAVHGLPTGDTGLFGRRKLVEAIEFVEAWNRSVVLYRATLRRHQGTLATKAAISGVILRDALTTTDEKAACLAVLECRMLSLCDRLACPGVLNTIAEVPGSRLATVSRGTARVYGVRPTYMRSNTITKWIPRSSVASMCSAANLAGGGSAGKMLYLVANATPYDRADPTTLRHMPGIELELILSSMPVQQVHSRIASRMKPPQSAGVEFQCFGIVRLGTFYAPDMMCANVGEWRIHSRQEYILPKIVINVPSNGNNYDEDEDEEDSEGSTASKRSRL